MPWCPWKFTVYRLRSPLERLGAFKNATGGKKGCVKFFTWCLQCSHRFSRRSYYAILLSFRKHVSSLSVNVSTYQWKCLCLFHGRCPQADVCVVFLLLICIRKITYSTNFSIAVSWSVWHLKISIVNFLVSICLVVVLNGLYRLIS